MNTRSAEAQAFFDQGLRLTYAFNHDEAARSFARAAEIDPGCAMCSWGAAYALGPNYNMPRLPDRARAGWEALQRALDASEGGPPVEWALIVALAERYPGPEWLDKDAMAQLNQVYADAMREVALRFPADDDVQVLFAEALMNTDPWRLWSADGQPAAITPEIVGTLETILARSPEHPGANHFYIHAIEASPDPGRAVDSADRLGGLMPAAGHLVHMPAHIYQRIGRYADASEANRRAVVADLALEEELPAIGYYPFYLAHNHGFLAFSASMQGRAAESLDAARLSAAAMPRDLVCGMPGMDFFVAEPLLVMVRFGRWDQLLAEPKPDPKYPVHTGLWHHAHGMAAASTGDPAAAREDLEALRQLAQDLPPEMISDLNQSRAILEVGAQALEARIAEVEGRPETLALWSEAVALEDGLSYSEPADWFYPLRHFLGAALLDAGLAEEAEAVYREDLDRNPNNGWALFGLWKALEAQRRDTDAALAEGGFHRAWRDADIPLSRSAF